MVQKTGKKAGKRGNGAVVGASKSSNQNSKRKNTRLYKFLKIILIVTLIMCAINVIKDLTKKSPENVSMIIGDKKVDLINSIIVDKNNNIYVSIDDIKELYDNSIYYNNNILVSTFNMHIAVLEKEKTTMRVNDVVQETKGTLKEINGKVYLPFSDMEDVYDFTKSYNKETKVLSVDSKLIEKKEAIVLKNAKLKETTKNFANTIEKLKKTEYVTVFEKEGDYYKVRSKSGNIGYIDQSKISKPEVLWENMDEEKISSINVLKDFSIVNSQYEVLNSAQENSIVTPNLFKIVLGEDENASLENVIDISSSKFASYKEWAQNSNVEICPTVTLECNMSKLCSSYESRSYVINTLFNSLVNNQLKMVCIDFSEVDDTEGLYRFVTEMIPRFKCAGMRVLIKNNTSLNKDRLSNIVDYIID